MLTLEKQLIQIKEQCQQMSEALVAANAKIDQLEKENRQLKASRFKSFAINSPVDFERVFKSL